ncbi:disease resistance protein RPM1-like [Durio zibethinus]|uniref:Disease resistance protein RPM1-like n=1 Tax=Durio zibethinus TaxID=66656 RepID=A0A6P5WQH3_DURZI|nr:disease resistance protein RPM1-like [Durio zibethinus]
MAEAAVNLVLNRLIALLKEEAKVLRGVNREVEDIKIELEFISSFLRDADARAEESNNGVKTWVRHIREAAYSIEDAIDEYMLYVGKHGDQHGFKDFLTKIACMIKSVKRQREMVSKIQELKRSVHEIGEKSRRYGFNISEQGGSSRGANDKKWHDPRAGLHFVENDALVGIEPLKNELIGRLIHGAAIRTVISLVGMGGIGKTTLAKKVYDHQTVKGHFDYRAWITVSQSHNTVERLRTMIRRFYETKKELPPNGIDAMDKEELISKSREYLHDKRYVVVFDDVWNEDFWQDIEYALPETNSGIRIIITTRSLSVAEFCKKSSLLHVHNLAPLSLEMAQELLCTRAFQFDQQKQCPPELKDLSFDIVKKCEGLPLAIVAIGGLLSTKGKDVLQWERFHNNLSAQLESNPHLTYVKKILAFSYLDLPHYLKSCFLYLGLFPHNYSIRSKRLIRLWIAEGLIKEKQEMTLEEIAQEYLTMLIHRSLVQVQWRDSTGRVRKLRVHDLMHEVVLSKLEELNLIHQSSQVHMTSTNGTARHLSIYNGECDLSSRNGNFQTHSVIFFSVRELPKSLFTMLSRSFKLLREIDFERASLEYVPEELGTLLHLRYLSLRETKVKMLPRSIGKLHNLQTLDLKRSLVQELPIEISGLRNLQYLVAYSVDFDNHYSIHSVQGARINGSTIRSLESLETLLHVEFQPQNGGDFFNEFGRLTRLRKLGITKLKSEGGMALCDAIQQMHHLESLHISSVKEDEFLQLQSMSSPPLFLQRVRLEGQLVKLPDWISTLKNLVKISLHWSRISDDSLKILGGLPNLLEFWLYDGYDGAEMHFGEGQFRKLKHLGLRTLEGLKKLTTDKGSLACLEILIIGASPQLQEVPTNICNLKCLQTLEFDEMPKEFARKILPNEGPDYWKVQHIPNVHFRYRAEGGQRGTYKLGDFRLYQYLC